MKVKKAILGGLVSTAFFLSNVFAQATTQTQ